MTLTEDERAVVFLDALSKLEYVHKYGLFKFLKKPSELFTDKSAVLKYFKSVGKESYSGAILTALKDEKFVEELILGGVEKADGVITYFSKDYPEELKNIQNPPLALYYKGNKDLLKSEKKFSIVGSRKTLGEYLVKTEDISKRLSEAGVTVVTGIAEGGDKSAIDGAIKSGNIISVFAGGVDVIYPKRHEDLINKVAEKGLIISEKPCGAPALSYMFIMRNRIIAGLGKGTLIVSGGANSGTRHTAEFALVCGREVCCFPYGFGEAGRVCKDLLKNGATMVESAEEVAETVGFDLKPQKNVLLSGEEKMILGLIENGVTEADEIIASSPFSTQKTIETLASLEIKRVIAKTLNSYGAI